MVIGILNFGEGMLWLNYLIFCTIGSWGALQIMAAQARLVGLMLLPPGANKWLGGLAVAGAYIWFFTVQPDLFTPGLAGGEFFVEFLIGFIFAFMLSLGLGILSNRIRYTAAQQPFRREVASLTGGLSAELWLPRQANPPLILALREANRDGLDILSSQLVTSGAAVLLCDEALAASALEFVHAQAERFPPTRRYAMGVGRGADRALQLAETDQTIRRVLALAPFGETVNARAGLRWLCEMDYWSAFRVTRRGGELVAVPASPRAMIVYGDEDMLMRPKTARRLYPASVMIAGARHWTLAATPATLKLAADWFEVHLAAPSVIPSRASTVQGEPGE